MAQKFPASLGVDVEFSPSTTSMQIGESAI